MVEVGAQVLVQEVEDSEVGQVVVEGLLVVVEEVGLGVHSEVTEEGAEAHLEALAEVVAGFEVFESIHVRTTRKYASLTLLSRAPKKRFVMLQWILYPVHNRYPACFFIQTFRYGP